MHKLVLFLLIVLYSCSSPEVDKVPEYLIGNFEDDYGISYSISDSLFEMEDHTKIHILEWNIEEQFFAGQNDSTNIYDPFLYSRIDWIEFEDMENFKWGFCMSAYNEVSLDSAKITKTVNRAVPRTGCNGHPFSRMKRVTN